jgi:hypothetical protein
MAKQQAEWSGRVGFILSTAMPWLKFQIANFASAVLWATGILTPGFVGARWLLG